ncbi:efflux RND transporter permease subunit [Pseudothauera nasutitermitis]|uniref:Efflux RND transporter permease subunit n=1 Tax=Pseudothauera nasutitermitis TaxID=2565930 RepID=A0A4S4APF4_9RHOO|nr:CusA/CzcA family heavy metal efflux RND transporter [Pseudothauera nasutitermitis]THF61137.1 efflux RND transporter permease subunit [Pseudothauera nasutitermitis]
MLDRIITWSARNAFLVLLLTAFTVAAGVWAVLRTPLDALPDLSDVQVIVYADYPGQAPQVVEDQVTYPLSSALLAVPKAKVVRGISMFGASYVYVIFEDGTDIYWARSRVLEYLSAAAGRMPAEVSPRIGPDATGVGWVYQYTLDGPGQSLAELRSLQDWYVRYPLTQVAGVAEVASVGGFVREYQITVDPYRLASYGLDLEAVNRAVRDSNRDVGGRVVEMAETEYMVRGRGYLNSAADIGDIVLRASGGTPVRVRDVARVELVPAERRGIAELNGTGEVASGIVMARFGENALEVIRGIKDKIAELAPGLPAGVEIIPVYDRSALIERAIDTLKTTLIEESLIVAAVCVVFLLHVRSALVAIVSLPVGMLIAFLAMQWLGIGSNIMSLGGIAIAIGTMVDGAIVMIENAHKHLERLGDKAADTRARAAAMIDACREVGPAIFFSLLIITVSFLPVFALEGQEGRLFSPLAFTKTFAMAGAALLSVTLIPVLMMIFIRGKILPEEKNPVNRVLIRLYRPLIAWVMRHKLATLAVALVVSAASLWPAGRIGSEFMPTLNEGALFYMPAALPGMSVTKAGELLATTNRIIKRFPEVESVYGKAGRASTATDPAPLEMFETVINLKPEAEWRPGMTVDKLIAEMDAALRFPGVANSWTMPIKARIDMLSTGIRTPVGVKVFGPDLATIEQVARQVETVVRNIPGAASVYAERVTGGYYLDIVPDQHQLARLGLTVGMLQDTVATALGGEPLTATVEGPARYNVTVRYPRALRADPERIAREVFIALPEGGMVPLGQVAQVRVVRDAPVVRTENALPVAYVYVDLRERDIGSFVAEARQVVAEQVAFPPGAYATWSGQFEYMERARARLTVVVPVTLALIVLLLYLNFRRLTETFIVLLSVPFALIGGVWLMWWLGYEMSVAVAVGFIALAGIAAETGVVMLIYLDHAWTRLLERCRALGRAPDAAEFYGAIMEGAVERVRPKMMTAISVILGLAPIMWSTGTGSEVMRRIAAPVLGGMVSSTVLTLIVIPALYALVKEWQLRRDGARADLAAGEPAA